MFNLIHYVYIEWGETMKVQQEHLVKEFSSTLTQKNIKNQEDLIWFYVCSVTEEVKSLVYKKKKKKKKKQRTNWPRVSWSILFSINLFIIDLFVSEAYKQV